MKRKDQPASSSLQQLQVEMRGLYREPMPGQRWVSARQQKCWCPPTDVYETNSSVMVKVEIAGMREEDFAISLDGKVLTISGVRHDPAAKLAYQQMEILYGQFETDVHLPWAIEEKGIEATYRNGFLTVRLPKARPRHVPVVSTEDAS